MPPMDGMVETPAIGIPSGRLIAGTQSNSATATDVWILPMTA